MRATLLSCKAILEQSIVIDGELYFGNGGDSIDHLSEFCVRNSDVSTGNLTSQSIAVFSPRYYHIPYFSILSYADFTATEYPTDALTKG